MHFLAPVVSQVIGPGAPTVPCAAAPVVNKVIGAPPVESRPMSVTVTAVSSFVVAETFWAIVAANTDSGKAAARRSVMSRALRMRRTGASELARGLVFDRDMSAIAHRPGPRP